MNPKIEYEPIKIVMITRTWRPNLAFQYRTTAERNRRLNQRMEWPRWYLDPAAEPDPPHARTPLAEAMESGELERPARGRRTIADAMEGEER